MKGKATKYGCKKRVKGQCPLRGQGAELPCGVWGNAPTVFRALNSKGTVNKGAGSEASLPVTSRVRRRASKLLFPTSVLCRARWVRPCSWSCDQSCSFPQAGISRLRARPEGFAVALWTASHALPCYLILIVAEGFRLCGGDQRAMKTDEVCDRPLETFGAATFGVICGLILFPDKNAPRCAANFSFWLT